MGRAVRLAVVGLGDIAATAHLPAIARSADVELVAVADVDAERRAAAARMDATANATRAGTGAVAAYTDIDPILADEDIDALVLATPPWVTTGLAARALEAGKYVLAEKPIATSVRATQPLARLPEALLARLQVGLTYRHDPALAELRALIEHGPLGGPKLMRAHIYDERLDRTAPEHEDRLRRTLDHGPPVIHEGAHVFDWLSFLLGAEADSAEVADAWAVRTDDDFGNPNLVGARLAYPDGSIALVEFGWLTRALPRCEVSVLAAEAYAVLDGFTFALTVNSGTTRDVAFPGDRTVRCFDRQLAAFVDLVRGRSERAVPGWYEGIASLRTSERVAGSVTPSASEREGTDA